MDYKIFLKLTDGNSFSPTYEIKLTMINTAP